MTATLRKKNFGQTPTELMVISANKNKAEYSIAVWQKNPRHASKCSRVYLNKRNFFFRFEFRFFSSHVSSHVFSIGLFHFVFQSFCLIARLKTLKTVLFYENVQNVIVLCKMIAMKAFGRVRGEFFFQMQNFFFYYELYRFLRAK